MKPLPARPDIEQLKRQAKELLRAFRSGDLTASMRFIDNLPAAKHHLSVRLHDAQTCIAREHGFDSWADLRAYVEAARARLLDSAALKLAFCRLVYAGDIAGGTNRARPHAAARLLADHPDIPDGDPWVACAAGDVEAVRRQVDADPSFVNQTGGPLGLTPLVAVTHSSLLRLDGFRERLHEIARLLLAAGADPNLTVVRRWEAPDADPGEWTASALHGAAGVNFDPQLTRILLAAGADPNDNESLYHSLDNPVCTPILLEGGARVTGTNALFRSLDFDDLQTFRLLLAHSAGIEELKGGRLLLWAIRRRRSVAHVEAMLAAGVDAHAKTRDGVSACTQAQRYGLTDVAAVLKQAGAEAQLSEEDRFIAACARGDENEARAIIATRPDLPAGLDETRLKMLPELAAAGAADAVRLMVDLGWPIAVRGGDWNASALNHAVFNGDAQLTRYLLKSGASWTEEHGFGDNACGTLGWASWNRPNETGDWVGCAGALVTHGMRGATEDPGSPDGVLVAGKRRYFADDVRTYLLERGGSG